MTTVQFPKKRGHGPGMIGVVCGELMRYSHFFMTFMTLQWPDGTVPFIDPGLDVVLQCNKMVKAARQAGSEWLFIMGDDHVFDSDLLMRLLDRDKDVIVPYCLQRSAPFAPVVYQGINADGHYEPYYNLPREGVVEIYAAGSAGMLIQKRVIDAVPEEPFVTSAGHHNEDLEFCRNVREAGYKIWCDVDARLGHVGTMWCVPSWMGDHWGIALTIGPEIQMPIRRIDGKESLTAA